MKDHIVRLFQKWPGTNQGAALVISLFIILSLLLLGLSILLQSNTEHMIAVNERDATVTLFNAESALQLVRAVFRNAADLNGEFRGPDGTFPSADDNIIGIKDFQAGISVDQLDGNCSPGSVTCEQTVSVLYQIGSKNFEAFRIGQDSNGDGTWDGPRGLVFVRIDDDHDESPLLDDPYTDLDQRAQVTIVSRFPIRVAANGTVIADESQEMRSAFLRTVGVSQRTLLAQFGPSLQQPAIVSRTDMVIDGSMEVCGACGSIHADTTLTIGPDDVDICQNATATAGDPIMNDLGTAEIGNPPAQQAPYIEVPVANPYHEDYVPPVGLFDTLTDSELAGTPFLQCDAWDSNQPGRSKYFAFVADGDGGLVFKAYWNGTAYDWELIDDLGDGNNTVLDDCGRVVSSVFSSTVAGRLQEDPPGSGIFADAGHGTGVNDGSDNHFYDFTFQNPSAVALSCALIDDDTIHDDAENDFGTPTADPDASPGVYMLPGTNAPDSARDFVAEDCMGVTDNIWRINGGNVWSPLYNSVIFVYGNLDLDGGPDTLCSTASPCNAHAPLPGGVWRVTFIAFNNIDTGGTPAYGPVRAFDATPDSPNYQYGLISGRDIRLRGNSGGQGNICPAQCDGPPGALAGYAGFVRAHEQVIYTGSAAVNGVVQAEDAAQCSPFITGPGISLSGNGKIYYDCEHPPSTPTSGFVMTSWAELNQ